MKEKILKFKSQIIIVTLIIIIIIASFIPTLPTEKEDIVIEEKKTEPKDTSKTIKVDIKGEVNAKGVYELKEGARVMDLIEKAGGLTDNADTQIINLSKKLEDQNVIIIYSKAEVQKIKANNEESKQVVCECPETNDACISKDDVLETILDNKTASSKTEQSQSSTNVSEKISINTATEEELTTLSGIGSSKAKAIIEYRNKKGKFKTIEDIKNVEGIGDSIYEKIKNNITL